MGAGQRQQRKLELELLVPSLCHFALFILALNGLAVNRRSPVSLADDQLCQISGKKGFPKGRVYVLQNHQPWLSLFFLQSIYMPKERV